MALRSFPFQLIPLLYVADKYNKCNYLIDTGAAVSVLPKSCANRTSDAACLPLVAANNTTINTYGNCRRVSEWSPAPHMVPKKIHIQDFTQRLAGSKDLVRAYYQIPDTRYRSSRPTCMKQRLQHLSICSISLGHRLA